MGNLFASFNAGVSGLQAAQTSLYTAAHNLSNATTEGHTRQQVMVTDSPYTTQYGAWSNRIQVGKGADVATIRQVRNTFLDAQYRRQLARQSFYEAQYNAVTEIEDVFGEMEGEEFLDTLGEGLWKAISNLQESPQDIVARAELVSVASQFIERAGVLQNQLFEYQRNMNQEVQNQVNAINDIVSQVRDYNSLIRKFEATGERANDYRDARNLLLDQLGSYINYKQSEEVDGTVSIYAEGGFLLEGNVQFRLATAYESDTSKLLKPVWEVGDDFFFRGDLYYSIEDNTDTGSLRGLMVARGNNATDYTYIPQKPKEEDFINKEGILDARTYFNATEEYNRQVEDYNTNVQPSIIMTVQAQFDRLIHGIVTLMNDTFCPNKDIEIELPDGTTKTITVLDTEKAAIGDDADKTMGTELFVRRNMPRYTMTEVTIPGETEPVIVYQYNEEDASDRYSLYTIEQLDVNPELLRDPSKLPLNANPADKFVDGYAWDSCEDMLKKWKEDFSALDPNSSATYDFTGYYGALVGQFAVQGNVWRGIVENQESTVYAIEGERQNVMGVSTDEELSDLIKFQQCYNASSRYITVVDEMIEHLITRL